MTLSEILLLGMSALLVVGVCGALYRLHQIQKHISRKPPMRVGTFTERSRTPRVLPPTAPTPPRTPAVPRLPPLTPLPPLSDGFDTILDQVRQEVQDATATLDRAMADHPSSTWSFSVHTTIGNERAFQNPPIAEPAASTPPPPLRSKWQRLKDEE